MSAAQLKHIEAGRYQVSGPLIFQTVKALLATSSAAFQQQPPREIDLSAVTSGDSAGLALLIEWMSMTHQRGGEVRFTGTPKQLTALAKISDLDKVLSLNGA